MADDEAGTSQTILEQLVKALSSQNQSEQIDLPRFRPEVDDASKWLSYVEDIRKEFGWSDVQTLSRIGRYLSHSAKQWFENWAPYSRNWETFRIDFLEAFLQKRNLGRLLDEAVRFNISKTSTYEAYVHGKHNLLKNVRALWTESDMVELIVHGIVETDVRVAANNQNCQTVAHLLSYLSPYFKDVKSNHHYRPTGASSSRKRHHDGRVEGPQPRKCFGCGQIGHIRANCPTYRRGEPREGTSRLSTQHTIL